MVWVPKSFGGSCGISLALVEGVERGVLDGERRKIFERVLGACVGSELLQRVLRQTRTHFD